MLSFSTFLAHFNWLVFSIFFPPGQDPPPQLHHTIATIAHQATATAAKHRNVECKFASLASSSLEAGTSSELFFQATPEHQIQRKTSQKRFIYAMHDLAPRKHLHKICTPSVVVVVEIIYRSAFSGVYSGDLIETREPAKSRYSMDSRTRNSRYTSLFVETRPFLVRI